MGLMRIGYIYYDFYPVKGGASVHGFNLAKELSNLGYRLYKINGAADPYTKKYSSRFFGFLKILRDSDVIYLRMDYFFKLRNISSLFSLITGKKLIIELNSPSDELYLYGKSIRYVMWVDILVRFILKRADAVIVVSEPIKRYCLEALSLNPDKVHVVENGGEVFQFDHESLDSGKKSQRAMLLDSKIKEIKDKYRQVAVWAGSSNKMQDLKWLNEISAFQKDKTAFIIIMKEEKGDQIEFGSQNQFLFKNLSRSEVSKVILSSDFGLAFYDDYQWSRWGFYNSSLKIFEFLNNNLITLSNIEGTDVQRKYPNFLIAKDSEAVINILNSDLNLKPEKSQIRTWEVVGKEVSEIIQQVYNS